MYTHQSAQMSRSFPPPLSPSLSTWALNLYVKKKKEKMSVRLNKPENEQCHMLAPFISRSFKLRHGQLFLLLLHKSCESAWLRAIHQIHRGDMQLFWGSNLKTVCFIQCLVLQCTFFIIHFCCYFKDCLSQRFPWLKCIRKCQDFFSRNSQSRT